MHVRTLSLALLVTTTAALAQTTPHGLTTETFNGRPLLLYTPQTPPAAGTRSLVVVLHGGLGNASRIAGGTAESGLNMNTVAEKNGFFVAYLNGTPVTRGMGANFLGWNAGGGCCGVPFQTNVDDVAYITAAVQHLVSAHGIDPRHVYGIGHSNGAMMSMRLACETTVYAAAISIAGPLNLRPATCAAAKGIRILSLHGADDQNVPIAGGRGTKGLSGVPFQSEAYTQQTFTAAGADIHLQVVPSADHLLDNIQAKLQATEHQSIAEKAARFFGLAP